MEFIQFHPTGMVWPPSVRGILVTEGVRGEGGILKNSEGRRFMFDDIPGQLQRPDRRQRRRRLAIHAGRQKRPPPARAAHPRPRRPLHHPRSESGPRLAARRRVSRHRLDQGEDCRTRPSTSRKSCRAMYHQFMQLANLDITTTPMEVGPTTHYIMGGIRVDADTQASTVPGLFAAGECAAGINGANRLGGNSLSDLIVFGKRAGEYAAKFAQENAAGTIDDDAGRAEGARPRSNLSTARAARTRSRSSTTCRTMMQDLVGIVRTRRRDAGGPRRARSSAQARRQRLVPGNVDFNPGWHTALDLHNLLTVSEAITRAAIERKESRGGQFRDDLSAKGPGICKVQFRRSKKRADGAMEISRSPDPRNAGGVETDDRGDGVRIFATKTRIARITLLIRDIRVSVARFLMA